MKFNIKKHLQHNATLKVVSLIIGYGLWNIISYSHTHIVSIEAPVCLYHESPTQEIVAPTSVILELHGKKNALRSIDTSTLAIHIDASKLHHGANPLIIDRSTLFLPETINVVHYTPANIVIIVKEKITA